MYTGSHALLDALVTAGVSHLFANFGSDHPGLLEAIAERRAAGARVPVVIVAPNEMVGMSAAHGFYQVSGQAQAVLVHVECGTQSLGGAIHNAAKGRVPVIVIAGASPFTQAGELPGSRNEFIQWIQDVHDQRGIVRGYMKYDHELRTAANLPQIVHRAIRIATSDPPGPVYLMAAREVLAQPAVRPSAATDGSAWRPLAPAALPADGVAAIAAALAGAERPLVVTSYLGRQPAAVGELVRLCRRLGIGVLESVPTYVNVPHADPLYQGNQWNEPVQNPVLAAADVILVIQSDVPWIPTVSRPSRDALIFHVDIDPLKEQMPLWHIDARQSFRCDAELALRQINTHLENLPVDDAAVERRRSHYAALHAQREARLEALEQPPADGSITPEFLVACVRAVDDENTVFLNEGISNYPTVLNHLRPSRPGSIFASGGGSLGWHGGAAIGVKLACPDKTVIALTGDGSYMFSEPAAVHWMSRRYDAPFLQIIFNNGGWKSPKLSALSVHPAGHFQRAPNHDVTFDPAPAYAAIAAAAGGAFARQVRRADELRSVLAEAMNEVRIKNRSAVLDVIVPGL